MHSWISSSVQRHLKTQGDILIKIHEETGGYIYDDANSNEANFDMFDVKLLRLHKKIKILVRETRAYHQIRKQGMQLESKSDGPYVNEQMIHNLFHQLEILFKNVKADFEGLKEIQNLLEDKSQLYRRFQKKEEESPTRDNRDLQMKQIERLISRMHHHIHHDPEESMEEELASDGFAEFLSQQSTKPLSRSEKINYLISYRQTNTDDEIEKAMNRLDGTMMNILDEGESFIDLTNVLARQQEFKAKAEAKMEIFHEKLDELANQNKHLQESIDNSNKMLEDLQKESKRVSVNLELSNKKIRQSRAMARRYCRFVTCSIGMLVCIIFLGVFFIAIVTLFRAQLPFT